MLFQLYGILLLLVAVADAFYDPDIWTVVWAVAGIFWAIAGMRELLKYKKKVESVNRYILLSRQNNTDIMTSWEHEKTKFTVIIRTESEPRS